jgi:DNA anti-recombination protein RmuC
MHDVIIVGIPLLAILAGIFFGRSDTKDLRGEMQALRGEMQSRFNRVDDRFSKVEDHLGRIDADLRQFYHLTGKLEARMDSFDKRG